MFRWIISLTGLTLLVLFTSMNSHAMRSGVRASTKNKPNGRRPHKPKTHSPTMAARTQRLREAKRAEATRHRRELPSLPVERTPSRRGRRGRRGAISSEDIRRLQQQHTTPDGSLADMLQRSARIDGPPASPAPDSGSPAPILLEHVTTPAAPTQRISILPENSAPSSPKTPGPASPSPDGLAPMDIDTPETPL